MIELNFPNAVRDQNDLFGRAAEIETARQALRARSRQPIVILGERLIGKTSLHQVLARELDQDARKSVLAIFPPPAYTLALFASEIVESIRADLSLLGVAAHTPAITARAQAQAMTQAEFLLLCRQLLSALPHATVVLCIDEFDSLLLKCAKPEQQAILDFTSTLAERGDLPLILLFTMSHPTEKIGDAYPLRFLAKSFKIPLPPLDAASTAELVLQLLASRFEVAESAQKEIWKFSGGHPYFVKLVLQNVLDLHFANQAVKVLTAEMVQQAARRAQSSIEARFSLTNILSEHFSERENAALKWLATREGALAWHQTEAHTDALQNLIQREYVEDRAGDGLTFRIGFIRAWLRAASFLPTVHPPPSPVARPATIGKPILVVDDAKRRVYLGEREIQTTPLEYSVLVCLARHLGKCVSRDELAQEVWANEVYGKGVGDDRIYTIMKRLRGKLDDDDQEPTYIETRAGLGYILHHAEYRAGAG